MLLTYSTPAIAIWAAKVSLLLLTVGGVGLLLNVALYACSLLASGLRGLADKQRA
jgi:hypothetical protein